jgi:MtrB/PioB family decaheme-associated outer membrane protein
MSVRYRSFEARSSTLAACALLVLAALPGGSARAQTPDTSNWMCRRCPFRTGYEADYSAGTSYVSDDSAHFGDATGYDKQGAYLNLDGDGFYTGEKQRMRWSIEDLGLDARVLALEGGQPGHFDYSFEYRELPRREFDTTKTVFSGGADALSVPDGWVRAGTTSGFSALGTSLFGRDIKSDRKALALGGRYVWTDGFDVFADYRRTQHDGVGIQGAPYYSNTSLLPRPFDYATNELDLGLRRAGAKSSMKLAYYGSFFNDAGLRLGWQDPFTSAPGAEAGALARPPDSSFQQLSLSGDYRLSRYDAMLTFSAARGTMQQDSALLAYTTNANIATTPLPRQSLDGRVATTNVAVTSTLRPYRLVRLKASYRYDDRDNKTPVEEWNRVIAETFDSGELVPNTPYSFTRSRLSLGADYDLRPRLRLSAGYDDARLDRDYQEVARQDETTGWGQISWRPNGSLDLRGRAGTSERDVDYDASIGESLGQNPLMRKYNLAYRYRKFTELTVAGSLPNKPLSLSGTLRRADDSYTKSELGLLASDDRQFAADLTWSVTDTSSLYFTAAFDRIDSEQAGSAQFAAPDWRASYADEFDSLTAGYRTAQLTERLNLEIDYTHGRGRSKVTVGSRFPNLGSTLDSLRLRFGYRVSERLQGSLELWYQGFEADDWSLDGVGPATLPNVLTLGATPYDYDVFLIGVGVRYALGGEGGGPSPSGSQSGTP